MLSAITGAELTFMERVVFLVLLVLASGMAVRTLSRRFALIRSGRPVSGPLEDRGSRFKRLLKYVPGQWCNIQNISIEDLAGVQHLLLFFGAMFLGVYYALFVILGDGLGFSGVLSQNAAARVFIHITELFALGIIVALIWGLARRTLARPSRLGPDYEAVTFGLIALGGTVLMLCFLGLEALRAQLGMVPSAGPVSGLLIEPLQRMFGEAGEMERMHHVFWWVQAFFIIAFVFYVPFSKHQHALFSPFNIFAYSPKPRGRIEAVTLDEQYGGVARTNDLTQKQLLELYGCTQCGRCQDACPAHAMGKPLSPKKVIQDLRKWMDHQGHIRAPWDGQDNGKKSAVEHFAPADATWSCTTCMACVEACPAFISAFDKIIDLRRDAVLAKGQASPGVVTFFREVEVYGDTFGKGKALREDWILGRDFKLLTEDTETDVLFWVGCQATFNDRNKAGATALLDILHRAGTDVAILGKGEMCCGDPLRRMGNEYLFQKMAKANIDLLNGLKFKRIVTYCPHCFNMLKNEYPQFGGNYEVLHYTEYLKNMIKDGQLKLNKTTPARVVFHDPCYLARGNGIFREPRRILSSIAGTTLLETPRSREKTFCCGGGGGHMWIGGSQGGRINEERVKELTAHGVNMILTSCPYCLVMLEDGVKSLQMDTVKCMDLVEYIQERM